MRKRLLLMIIAVMLLNLTACGGDTTAEEKEEFDGTLNIAILIYRFDDEFITYVMDEISKEKENLEKAYNKTIAIEFINGNNQADLQLDQIKKSIDDEVDVLAINLVDRSQAAAAIDLAKNAEIPIVFFNREPVQVDMARWDKIYYVGSKGEDSGRIQGEIVADTWKENPEVDKNGDGVLQYILLEGQAGHQDVILRSEMSVKAITESGIEVQELVRDTANWQRNEAKDKMINYLDVFGDEVEFIISNNDMMALGAIDAMKELEMDKESFIPLVGVDAIDLAKMALEDGDLSGTVFNDNVKLGQMVMRIAYYLGIEEDPNDYIEEIENGKYYRVEYVKVVN
jgi:methyl-galactoside transport system substrate-binding protein